MRPLKRAAEAEDRFWSAVDEVIPPPVRTHLRNARREALLALRAMLDYAIAHAETSPRPRNLRRVRVR